MSKKIKAIVVGDTHIDDKKPALRKDNYLASSLEELQECLEIAQQREVDYFLHLGDLFHRMNPGGIARNETIELLRMDDWDFDKIIVPGNHDYKHNPANFPQSALATAMMTNAIRTADFIEEYSLGLVPFHSRVEDDLIGGDLRKKDATIWACHASITTQEVPYDAFVLFEELQVNKECRLVLSGHIHAAMDQIREDGVRFVNPGSVCRLTTEASELKKKPQILYLEYEPHGEVLVEKITLKSPQPAKAIFDLDAKKRSEKIAEETKEYVEQLSAVSVQLRGEDKVASLRQSAEAKGLDEKIVDYAIKAYLEVTLEDES